MINRKERRERKTQVAGRQPYFAPIAAVETVFALLSIRILARREDFGPRAVPARSTLARSKQSGISNTSPSVNPLRPGTGRDPLWLRLRDDGISVFSAVKGFCT
jgi:hypothetical protein